MPVAKTTPAIPSVRPVTAPLRPCPSRRLQPQPKQLRGVRCRLLAPARAAVCPCRRPVCWTVAWSARVAKNRSQASGRGRGAKSGLSGVSGLPERPRVASMRLAKPRGTTLASLSQATVTPVPRYSCPRRRRLLLRPHVSRRPAPRTRARSRRDLRPPRKPAGLILTLRSSHRRSSKRSASSANARRTSRASARPRSPSGMRTPASHPLILLPQRSLIARLAGVGRPCVHLWTLQGEAVPWLPPIAESLRGSPGWWRVSPWTTARRRP